MKKSNHPSLVEIPYENTTIIGIAYGNKVQTLCDKKDRTFGHIVEHDFKEKTLLKKIKGLSYNKIHVPEDFELVPAHIDAPRKKQKAEKEEIDDEEDILTMPDPVEEESALSYEVLDKILKLSSQKEAFWMIITNDDLWTFFRSDYLSRFYIDFEQISAKIVNQKTGHFGPKRSFKLYNRDIHTNEVVNLKVKLDYIFNLRDYEFNQDDVRNAFPKLKNIYFSNPERHLKWTNKKVKDGFEVISIPPESNKIASTFFTSTVKGVFFEQNYPIWSRDDLWPINAEVIFLGNSFDNFPFSFPPTLKRISIAQLSEVPQFRNYGSRRELVYTPRFKEGKPNEILRDFFIMNEFKIRNLVELDLSASDYEIPDITQLPLNIKVLKLPFIREDDINTATNKISKRLDELWVPSITYQGEVPPPGLQYANTKRVVIGNVVKNIGSLEKGKEFYVDFDIYVK